MQLDPVTVSELYKLAIQMSRFNSKTVKQNLELLLSQVRARNNGHNNSTKIRK